MTASPLFLGMDVGTTLCTCVVMDLSGRILARSSAPLTCRYPAPGHVEQDPNQLLTALLSAALPLLDQYPIRAAGLDNQGESFVLWDALTGTPLTPSIVWQDQRGADVCADVGRTLSAEEVRERTGLLLDSYFSAPKVRALVNENPKVAAAAREGTLRFGTTDSWMLRCLGVGHPHITDASTASRTLLWNLAEARWDPVMCGAFGVDAGWLPAVVPSVGHAVDLQLGNHRVPLTAMLTDQQAALFGQGCHRAGQVKCTLGTGAFVLLNTGPTRARSKAGLLSTVAWEAHGATTFALDGGVFTVGAAVEWLKDGLHIIDSLQASSDVAGQPVGQAVVVVPALAGLAAPQWLTAARGAMFGASRATNRADVVRGTLLGVAHLITDVVDAMERDSGVPIAELRVDGGPTRNAFLMQALADAGGRALSVSAEQEGTARGTAMLAAVGSGAVTMDHWKDAFVAGRLVVPQWDASRRHAERAQWKRALDALAVFHAG